MLTFVSMGMPAAQAQTDATYFPETGHYLSGLFRNFWNANGGVDIFGYPITPEYVSPSTGLITQYFERARFELADQQQVQLGMLGVEITAGRTFPKVPPIEDTPDRRYIPQTQHVIQYGFKEIWERHGAERIFGYPISEEISEVLQDGQWHTVQYFERARFEYWPSFPEGERVLLSHLGRMLAPPELTAPVPAGAPPAAPAAPPAEQPGAQPPAGTVPAPPLPASVNATVSPESGPPGTTFSFNATGFKDGERVGIWLTAPDQSTFDAGFQASANDDGTLADEDIKLETDTNFGPGIWSFNAKGVESEHEAIGYFRITSGAAVAAPTGDPARLGIIVHDQLQIQGAAFIVPMAAPSGTPFVFLGEGYNPGETIEAWVTKPDGGSEPIDPATIQLDASGIVQVQVPTIGFGDGVYSVTARGTASGVTNGAGFKITSDYVAGPGTPRPANTNGTVNPQEGGLGVTFQIRGEGFSPTEQLEFWVTEPTGSYTMFPGVLTADAQGRVGYEPPLDLTATNEFAPGVYGIHFRGMATGVRVDVYFTYVVPGTPGGPAPPPTGGEPSPQPQQPVAGTGVVIAHVESSFTENEDVNEEYALIENRSGAAVQMNNWTLRDEDDQKYTFPELLLEPGGQVRVWTRSGSDTAGNLFWGREDAVWNYTGDTAILRNPDGEDVSHFSYTNPNVNGLAAPAPLHQRATEQRMLSLSDWLR
jgi:hypothetical protein